MPTAPRLPLIPPTTNTAIYLEDANSTISNPVVWHTAPETYAKVISYQSGLPALPGAGSPVPPCFRVFLRNGVVEEFGCTQDSLMFYPQQTGSNVGKPYISSWLLDLIIDPEGNQIHVTYQRDMQTNSGMSYPRDAVLNTVEWDSPTCVDVSASCTAGGTSPHLWAPLMQVVFQASHSVAYTVGSSCPAVGTLRCDDPVDLSPSGDGAPIVQSDYVLNDVLVQVKDGNPAAWNTLRDYRLGYDQSGPGTEAIDPITGYQESVAGRFNLTRLTVLGDDGTTSLPVTNFTYSKMIQFYEDSLYFPSSSPGTGPIYYNPRPATAPTNCGGSDMSWNTGYYANSPPYTSGPFCVLWSKSYEGNSYYLSSVSNGLGLLQTFVWKNLRDNMHGVDYYDHSPTNYSLSYDPLFCTNQQAAGGGNTWPCDETDDEAWSRIGLYQVTNSLVRQTQAGQGGAITNTTVIGTTTYTYRNVFPLAVQECLLKDARGFYYQCVAGFMWGNQADNDYLDFYNGKFMGFPQVTVSEPDGSVEVHKFYSTEGWGVWSKSQVAVGCPAYPDPCNDDPWWDTSQLAAHPEQSNALHGHEYEVDLYDTDGTTLLRQVLTQYSVTCPSLWIANGSPPVTNYGNWAGNLVSSLDLGNPVASCDIQITQVDNKTLDGSGSTSVPDQTTTYTYETGTRPCTSCYGRIVKTTTTSNDGATNGSPTTIVKTAAYGWNDSLTPNATTPPSGRYLISFSASTDTEDSAGARYQCTFSLYDGQPYATGNSPNLVHGDITEVDRFSTTCGASPAASSGLIADKYGIDSFGNPIWSTDPNGNLGCTAGGATHSRCSTFDSYFDSLVTQRTNALNQTVATNYQAPSSASGGYGFGLWPMSMTDANGQTTSVTYDALGRQTSSTLPGETAGLTTQSMAYTVWCTGISAQSPCAEIDQTQRLNSTTTVTSRAFYDGMGHLVETRSPAPSGDIVQYYYYDPSQRLMFKSIPYLVASYTGVAGSAAYSLPDSTVVGTSYAYDGLGRTKTATDPKSKTTTTSISVVCNAPGTADTYCYEQALTVDPLGHQAGELVDAMGRINYEQRYTGNSSSTYALYATTKYRYDYLGDLTRILHPDGATTSNFTYDEVARRTAMTDPDRGTETYSYDPDGNLVQSVDARGTAGTVFIGYDAIDRPLWHNTTNSSSGAYNTYTYDSTAGGNFGVGRLTNETFANSPDNGLHNRYSYTYDVRGRQTAAVGGNSITYTLSTTYDDAGNVLTQTYPNGETVTNYYSSQGWLTRVSTVPVSGPQTGVTLNLINNATYSGFGGANGYITGATYGFLGGVSDSYSATYDELARPTEFKFTRNGTGATDYDVVRTFDDAGNVKTISTTLPAGTDNQAFCYDEQNRLTWAGSAGTPPCTGVAINPGTLTAAQYSQSASWDNMGRIATTPGGAYTYGSGHIHGVTAIGSRFTAAYDAAGNMTCRAPSGASCSGTPTGAQLTYNTEGQLSAWQNQPSSPTSTAIYLYDGQGNRTGQQTNQNGSITTTVYIGNVEEDSTTGTTTNKTTYYYANGTRIAMAVNGVFSRLASDPLGSAQVAFDINGNVTASVLYQPYGGTRYQSGTMPTSYGFTGQRADANTGLDYYGARYYDPSIGQFTSADAILSGGGFDVWGLSRYAYVEGNPILRTDPTGHCADDGAGHCYTQKQIDQMDGSAGQSTGSGSGSQPPGSSTPVVDGVSNFLDWATSPRVQQVNRGIAGDLDAWWDFVSGMSPPGILSAIGLGPSMRDPLAKLDRAVGGQASSTPEYQTGQIVAAVTQLGTVFTPGGGETSAGRITGFVKEGFERRWGSRGDGGVNLSALYDAVKNPIEVVPNSVRDTIRYVGKNATVVLNRAGEVVTTWPNNRFGRLW